MASEAIFKYLSDQNRPFSVNDVFENLQKQFGKTEVQKTIDKLVSQSKVIEKTYGKQKVYFVKQNDGPDTRDSMETELKALDKTITDLDSNLTETEDKLRKGDAELKAILATMTTEDARLERERLVEEIQTLEKKLETISGGANGSTSVVITPEIRNKAINENEKMAKEYRKRKRMCMDVINAIMDGYPKTKKNLIEDIGIETDEEVGFKLE